jgi:hypothetical protein
MLDGGWVIFFTWGKIGNDFVKGEVSFEDTIDNIGYRRGTTR